MKRLAGLLLITLAGLSIYVLCAWCPDRTAGIVQVMDQGKPGKAAIILEGAGEPREQEHTGQQDSQGDGRHTLPAEPASRQSHDPAPFKLIDARDPLITALGEAIAKEEGFFAWTGPHDVAPGTLAQRLHNPGMLVYAGQAGAEQRCLAITTYPPTTECDPYAHFLTDNAGWAALYVDMGAKWSSARVVNACGQYDLFDGGEGYDNLMRCKVHAIAYYWSTGDRDKYARDIVADLRGRGLLK